MKKVGRFVSYTDQVYREIKGAIISADIQAEESLHERTIAQTLGVSRTPVREALKKLEFEGWVETIPWKGVVVKEIDRKDVVEVFQCRYANESFVAQEVASTITDEQLQDLEDYFEKMKAVSNTDEQEFINEDRNFHMYMAQLTNNGRLVQFLDHLSDQILRLGIRAVDYEGRAEETLMEHQAILEGLKKRSPEEAKEAVERHIANSEVILLKLIDMKEDAT